jgi:hypothetical protein
LGNPRKAKGTRPTASNSVSAYPKFQKPAEHWSAAQAQLACGLTVKQERRWGREGAAILSLAIPRRIVCFRVPPLAVFMQYNLAPRALRPQRMEEKVFHSEHLCSPFGEGD